MRGGTVVHPILASIVNSFDSLAVPFFFIVAGYFFFNRIEKRICDKLSIENIENIFCLVSCAFTEQVDTE